MNIKKGLNEYRIEKDIVYLKIVTRSNKVYEAMIDLVVLQKLIDLNFCWHLSYAKTNCKNYVKATEYLGMVDGKYKYKTYFLHKLIINADFYKDQYINHINHNPLDNRKCNLEIVTKHQNDIHREKANKNTTSGERNVSWSNGQKKWLVQLQVNGKNTCFGTFEHDELDKAIALARLKREEIYGTLYMS